MKNELIASVKRTAHRLGADLVGTADAKVFEGAPEGHRPGDLLGGARSVIVMAVHLPDAVFESAPSREYSIAYLAANDELNRIAFSLAKFLQNKGHRALPIPASPPYDVALMMGDLSHRHAGFLAGLGVFGKNSLLLSPKFGPRIRLVSVITDAQLEADSPLHLDLCEECEKCIQACPVHALKGQGKVDKHRCDEHHVEVGELLQLEGWTQVCGVCIRVCPVGRRRKERKKD